MKKFMVITSIVILIGLMIEQAFGQGAPPPPPSGGGAGGSNNQPAGGGGAPVGSGIGILLALGAAYGGRKIYQWKQSLEE